MGVYSTECGVGEGIIRVFSMNSRQDKEFFEKNAFFAYFRGFSGKILPFGGVILVQDLGRIRIRLPGT